MQINLEEFIKYFLKKWKLISVIILLSAGIFIGTAAMFGEEIVVPHSEEYLYYEDELARHLVYVDESVLMTMDPTCFYERTLLLRNISDKEILKNYAISSEIWDDLETDRVKKYLPELLVWNDEETDTVELILRHATSEECEAWAEYLSEKLSAYDPSLEVIISEERIAADEDIELEQLRRYTRTEHIKSLWLDSRAGYTIKVSIPVAAAVGVIAGGMLSIVLILLIYMIHEKRGKRIEGFE